MSKGYADYVITIAHEVDREIMRERDGVEVPLFGNEFEEWLKESKELSEASVVNYMRWLHKADSWILDLSHDFWTLLKKAWNAADFQTAKALCKEYESLLLDEKSQAEKEGKEEYGESGKEIGNWISTFRKFIKFHDEQIEKVEGDKKVLAEKIEASRLKAANLFLETRFSLWGIDNGLSETTMDSYISGIRSVNRKLFCKTGYDLLHDFLPQYVKTKNEDKINEMFSAMDKLLSRRIDSYNETEMPRESFLNCRAALRKYTEFIRHLIITE